MIAQTKNKTLTTHVLEPWNLVGTKAKLDDGFRLFWACLLPLDLPLYTTTVPKHACNPPPLLPRWGGDTTMGPFHRQWLPFIQCSLGSSQIVASIERGGELQAYEDQEDFVKKKKKWCLVTPYIGAWFREENGEDPMCQHTEVAFWRASQKSYCPTFTIVVIS